MAMDIAGYPDQMSYGAKLDFRKAIQDNCDQIEKRMIERLHSSVEQSGMSARDVRMACLHLAGGGTLGERLDEAAKLAAFVIGGPISPPPSNGSGKAS